MVDHVENYRGVTREDLLNQLAVAEACREFWYRAYVRASTYALEQIDAVIAEAKEHIKANHEGCDDALDDMEKKIGGIMRKMFLTDGRKTGSNAVFPSSIPPDTHRP